MKQDDDKMYMQYIEQDVLALSCAIAQSRPFRDILDLAASIMDAPLIMTNSRRQVIAFSDYSLIADPQWSESIGFRLFAINNAADSDQILCEKAHGTSGYIFCYCNDGSPTKKQRVLLKYVTWLLFSAYNDTLDNCPRTKGEELLHFLLNNHAIDEADELDLNAALPEHMQVVSTECISDKTALDVSLRLLQALFYTDMVAIHKGRYAIALISEMTGSTKQRILDTLSDKGMRIGVSAPFDDIHMLREHAFQAVTAVTETDELGIHVPIADYTIYFPYHIFSSYSDPVSFSRYRHPVLELTDRYDSEHNTQLSETLYTYIRCNGSAAKTAEILHMHKNSVLRRLDKIRSITSYAVTEPQCQESLHYAYAIERLLTDS